MVPADVCSDAQTQGLEEVLQGHLTPGPLDVGARG